MFPGYSGLEFMEPVRRSPVHPVRATVRKEDQVIKEIIIQQAVTALIGSLPPELLRDSADQVLDVLERAIEQSDTKIDDAVVLPLIRLLRTSFSIPDND